MIALFVMVVCVMCLLASSIGYPVVTVSFLIKHQITHIIRLVSTSMHCTCEGIIEAVLLVLTAATATSGGRRECCIF